MTYADVFGTARKPVPVNKPMPGRESRMTRNPDGAVAFVAGDWVSLERFLILGAADAYYATAQELTIQNAQSAVRCLRQDGPAVVSLLCDIASKGRAAKLSPVLFVLALAVSPQYASETTRRLAKDAIPEICKTGTQLFEFVHNYQQFNTSWPRSMRTAVSRWYLDKTAKDLVYQLIKYQNRKIGENSWSHKDVVFLSHLNPTVWPRHSTIMSWLIKGEFDFELPNEDWEEQLEAFITLQSLDRTATQTAIRLIKEARLPREAVPTEFLKSPEVWEALLVDMPVEAMVRNITTMTRNGLLVPGSAAAKEVTNRLLDTTRLRRSRIHPLKLLTAQLAYALGSTVYDYAQPQRKMSSWTPVPSIVEALDAAFYLSFGNVTPSNKPTLLALDHSGSMHGGTIAGMPYMTPAQAQAALALVTKAVEPDCQIISIGTSIKEPRVSATDRLPDFMRKISQVPEATNLGLAFEYAEKHLGRKFENVAVFTDSMYNTGAQPQYYLEQYRKRLGKDVRATAVIMQSYGTSIFDPKDCNTLDVAGFDTVVPDLMGRFFLGEL